MSRKTVVVTGSNGFIGSHLVTALRGAYTVVGISTGSANHPGQADIYHQMALPSPDLDDIFRQHRPAFCIHCAGPASVGMSMDHPSVDFQSGPVTLFQIADAIRKAKLDCTVVFPSSAAVYGNPEAIPVRESASLKPISPYGHHKLMGEHILKEFAQIYGIPYMALRIFSCYGAGLRKQLLWDVARKVEAGRLDLFGTGEETRDFIHVRDLAALMKLLLDQGARDVVLNVGAGAQVPVRRIAELLATAMGRGDLRPSFSGSSRAGDPLRWEADVSRIRAFGFTPQVALEDGVAEYVKWYKREGI